MSCRREHWTQIDSTNPLERLNREVKRCTDLVPVLPNDDAALWLVGAIRPEIAEEWAADDRRYFRQTSMQLMLDRAAAPPALDVTVTAWAVRAWLHRIRYINPR